MSPGALLFIPDWVFLTFLFLFGSNKNHYMPIFTSKVMIQ